MNVRVLLLGVGLVAVACSGPSGRTISAAELARLEAQQAAAPPSLASGIPAGTPGTSPGDLPAMHPASAASASQAPSKDELEKRAIELQRRREDHVHAAEELDRRRVRLDLESQIEEANEQLAIDDATHDHTRAKAAYQHFMEVERDLRLRESNLDLRAAADALLETREELAQLEMMYGESDLGDATAEIVLVRTRRRLERAELRHKLAEERHVELRDVTLPRERTNLENELHEKVVRLANARRAQEKGAVDRDARRRELEREEIGLRRTLEDIERDEQLLARDRAEWELSLRRGS